MSDPSEKTRERITKCWLDVPSSCSRPNSTGSFIALYIVVVLAIAVYMVFR